MMMRLFLGGPLHGEYRAIETLTIIAAVQVPEGLKYRSAGVSYRTAAYRQRRVAVPGFKVTIPVMVVDNGVVVDWLWADEYWGWAFEQASTDERCPARRVGR